jgi:imidazolonepropionase-like amidohydrolase
MGLERHFGTVGPGKTADLLILDSDSTENIHITQLIFAVIARGRLFGREGLDTMLGPVSRNPLISLLRP